MEFHFTPAYSRFSKAFQCWYTASYPVYTVIVRMRYKKMDKNGNIVRAYHTEKFSQKMSADNVNSLGEEKTDDEIKAELLDESIEWIENMKIEFPSAKFKYI